MPTKADPFGQVTGPSGRYFGANTLRSVENFDVSDETLGDQPSLLTAIAQVKKAAALANMDGGVLHPVVATALVVAADEIIAGILGPNQFPVDMFSAGGGIAPNMNVNEVLANRANELLSAELGHEFVHPNAGQSTSDAMATAVNLALYREILLARDAVNHMADVLAEKIDLYGHTVKLSRTCLQDAVPVTFGQASGAYLDMARRGVARLDAAADTCLDVAMGATVVGTGLGIRAGYLDHIHPRLQEVTGRPLRKHPNIFDALQNGDVFMHASAAFKMLACGLVKMARDLRMLASSDRAGIGEIRLPAVQAGSSFMPGKVNPVMAELIVQVGLQVCANDLVVTMAVEGAELDFNAWIPVITRNLLESSKLLGRGTRLFADKCLSGPEIDPERNRKTAENSLGLSSVVSGVYGYEAGARAAHYAASNHVSIKDAVVELGIAPRDSAERLFDLAALTDTARSAELLEGMLAERQTYTAVLVGRLPLETRYAVFHAVCVFACAEGMTSRQRVHALTIIADALGLPEVPEAICDGPPVDMTKVDEPGREVAYSCAAWFADLDPASGHDTDAILLERLRERLDLERETAEKLRE
jgi:aspartate ammonia-lyase